MTTQKRDGELTFEGYTADEWYMYAAYLDQYWGTDTINAREARTIAKKLERLSGIVLA